MNVCASFSRRVLAGLAALVPCAAGAAQAPNPPGDPAIPGAAFERVARRPAELLRRPCEGLAFRQLLQVDREEFHVDEAGEEQPADKTTLEIQLSARYGQPGEALLPWELSFHGLKLSRLFQGRQVILDSCAPEELAADLREALAIFQASSLRVGVDREGRLVGISGGGELLPRVLAPIQAPGLRATIGRFLQGSLSAGALEGTLCRLHPPVPGGRLEPEQVFYRSFRVDLEPVGAFDVLLQHVYLGTCAVGPRRAGVFWSRLVFPAFENARLRAGGQEFVFSQPRSVGQGVVRVDLESGHVLTADVELLQEQTVLVGEAKIRKRSRQGFTLRTFAPEAD